MPDENCTSDDNYDDCGDTYDNTTTTNTTTTSTTTNNNRQKRRNNIPKFSAILAMARNNFIPKMELFYFLKETVMLVKMLIISWKQNLYNQK